MAKATMQVREEEVITKTQVRRVVVELSQDEVDALYAVLMKVGGSSIYSGRRYTNSVLEAISEFANIPNTRKHKFESPYSGSIYFQDER